MKASDHVILAHHQPAATMWGRGGKDYDEVSRGFGPLRQLAESLPPNSVERLKHDVDAYHRHYAVPAGLHMKREYLLTIGRRR